MFTFQTKLSMLRALVTRNAPFYIQFYISRACHLRCRMCNIVDATKDITPFAADKIEAIAENLVSVGAGVVLLTGGEPTLRPDIAEIVRVFKQHRLDVRLQTAGILSTWDRVAQCVQHGARDINVSIDSLDEGLSDYINGVQGSWRNAIKTIGFISRNFPGHDGICALGCVLSRYNADEIEPVLDFATQIGWWLSLVPVHIRSPASSLRFRGCDEGFAFLKGDSPKVLELLTRLKQKKKEGYLLYDSDDYLDSIGEFVTTGKPNWRRDGVCDSPGLYFAVMPDGRFAPCCDHVLPEDVFVYDPTFPSVYRSRSFREKVKAIVVQCPGCNFGSYPEMTLTVRRLATLKERVRLQVRTKRHKLKPVEEDELLVLMKGIRSQYEVYRHDRMQMVKDSLQHDCS